MIAGADVVEQKLLRETIEAIVVERPDPAEEEQHLCLDKGYDNPNGREAAAAGGYVRTSGGSARRPRSATDRGATGRGAGGGAGVRLAVEVPGHPGPVRQDLVVRRPRGRDGRNPRRPRAGGGARGLWAAWQGSALIGPVRGAVPMKPPSPTASNESGRHAAAFDAAQVLVEQSVRLVAELAEALARSVAVRAKSRAARQERGQAARQAR